MRTLLSISAALLWALLCVLPARAYIPSPERIAAAAAEANRSAGRTQLLELKVALYLGDSEQAVATGELLSDPGGLARLEIRSPEGIVERHLLRARELLASRDAVPLDAPRPFLPPVFLLQAKTGGVLMTSLRALGVSAHEVALGYEGEHDCYVLGGRAPASALPSPRSSLWVDQESLEPVRFDRGDGVRFLLGSFVAFDSIRLPSWIEIRDSQGFRARLEILGAQPVSPAAGSFRREWLNAP
jgi:hypothetical protein